MVAATAAAVPPPLSRPFHTGCVFTGRSICFCLHGTPPHLQDPAAAAQYCRQAHQAWQVWEDPATALGQRDTIEILLPRLLRRERLQAPPSHQQLGLPSLEEARQQAGAAAAAALSAVHRAAQVASAAGLSYTPPEDVGIDDQPPPQDFNVLEQQVQQVLAAQEQRRVAAEAASAHAARLARQLAAKQRAAVKQQGAAVGAWRGRMQRSGSVDLDGPSPGGPSSGSRGGKGGKHGGGAGRGKSPIGAKPAAAPGAPLGLDISVFPPGYQLRGPHKRNPPRSWLLRPSDLQALLRGKMVQLFWPDDGQWWPAVVLGAEAGESTVLLYYETGDEERVGLAELIEKGEVAWMSAGDARAAAAGDSAGGGSRRGRQSSFGSDVGDELAEAAAAAEAAGEEGPSTSMRQAAKRQRSGRASGGLAAADRSQEGLPSPTLHPQHQGGGGGGAGGFGGFNLVGSASQSLLYQEGAVGVPPQQQQQQAAPLVAPRGPTPPQQPTAAEVAGGSGGAAAASQPAARSEMRELLKQGDLAVGLEVRLYYGGGWHTALVSGCHPHQGMVQIATPAGKTARLHLHNEGTQYLVQMVR